MTVTRCLVPVVPHGADVLSLASDGTRFLHHDGW